LLTFNNLALEGIFLPQDFNNLAPVVVALFRELRGPQDCTTSPIEFTSILALVPEGR